MRYDDPRLLDSLAREYVIGTLHGRARRRFARVLSSSLVARRAVASWERQLTPLAKSVRPVQPPSETLRRIQAAIGLRTAKAPAAFSGPWAALAAALALVAIGFGSLYFTQRPVVEQPTYVAVISDAATGPVWLMQAYAAAQSLRVTTVNPRPVPAGNSYELWMIPNGANAQPVSLGLIPGAGNAALGLNAAQLAVLANTSTLAVSLEPAGGSPTGLPTGPVIFTAPLLRG
jgi:anti-sigma-K factor RskA